jgi:hypothetical protein
MVGNTIKLMGCSGDPVAAVNVENRVKSIMKILLQGVANKKGWA